MIKITGILILFIILFLSLNCKGGNLSRFKIDAVFGNPVGVWIFMDDLLCLTDSNLLIIEKAGEWKILKDDMKKEFDYYYSIASKNECKSLYNKTLKNKYASLQDAYNDLVEIYHIGKYGNLYIGTQMDFVNQKTRKFIKA